MNNLFEQRFNRLLEDMTAGGAGSVFGSGVETTADQFSGDNYAPGDARNVFGGKSPVVQTRPGMKGKCPKKKKKCGKTKRKS
jgi:hypothetical protein